MKKILKQTIFLSLCLLSGVAFGQGTGYLYHNSMNGWQNMIRHHTMTGNYVTYSWPLGYENHFALTDIQSMMMDAHVADGYYVQDFEVIDDFVFFCGYNASLSGFLGWFDINDLFYAGGRVYIDETLNLHGIERLDDIEVYYDKFKKIHIAGVGQHIVSGNLVGYKAFEAEGNLATGMQYRVADLQSWDMIPTLTVTADYVVYAKGDANVSSYGIGISLEPFPKDDMFATATHPVFFFQTVALFPNNCVYPSSPIMVPNACDPYNQKIKAVHRTGNIIAICNYRTGAVYLPCSWPYYWPDNRFDLVIREFDLSPLLISNPIQMTTDARIPLPLGVSDLKELRYDPWTMHYIVLFNHEISVGDYRDAILTADYSSGTAPVIVQASYQQIYQNWTSWSLCLNGSSRYTASGWESSAYNYHFWQDNVISVNDGCSIVRRYSVNNMSTEDNKENVVPSNVVGWIGLNFLPNIDVEIRYDINTLLCK